MFHAIMNAWIVMTIVRGAYVYIKNLVIEMVKVKRYLVWLGCAIMNMSHVEKDLIFFEFASQF